MDNCPICDAINPVIVVDDKQRYFRGITLLYKMQMHCCLACGIEYADADDLNLNADQSRKALIAAGFDPQQLIDEQTEEESNKLEV